VCSAGHTPHRAESLLKACTVESTSTVHCNDETPGWAKP
jgi:hypothetical protein